MQSHQVCSNPCKDRSVPSYLYISITHRMYLAFGEVHCLNNMIIQHQGHMAGNLKLVQLQPCWYSCLSRGSLLFYWITYQTHFFNTQTTHSNKYELIYGSKLKTKKYFQNQNMQKWLGGGGGDNYSWCMFYYLRPYLTGDNHKINCGTSSNKGENATKSASFKPSYCFCWIWIQVWEGGGSFYYKDRFP